MDQGQNLDGRQISKDSLDILNVGHLHEGFLAETEDDHRQEREDLEAVEAKHQVPEDQQLLRRQMTAEGTHQPLEHYADPEMKENILLNDQAR